MMSHIKKLLLTISLLVCSAYMPVQADEKGYSGTFKVQSFSSFSAFNSTYTRYRQLYEKRYEYDSAPPDGIRKSAYNDCSYIAKNNFTEEYTIVTYENFKGWVFIGLYQYMPSTYSHELKCIGFYAYFKR